MDMGDPTLAAAAPFSQPLSCRAAAWANHVEARVACGEGGDVAPLLPRRIWAAATTRPSENGSSAWAAPAAAVAYRLQIRWRPNRI
jgi:hypothetical protein